VSASSGAAKETSSKAESRSRNVFLIILLPFGGISLTRFSKTRMLLQAGEHAEEMPLARMRENGEKVAVRLGSLNFYGSSVDHVRLD